MSDARLTYRIRIRTPDDPEGWTAEAVGPVGYPYGYHSAGVAVELDFAPFPPDATEVLAAAESSVADWLRRRHDRP